MADTDRAKVERLRELEPEKYESVDLDHLVMYAIGQLEKIGADLSFENAVVAAFKLFPKKFSLIGYPSYPAGKRVHDCLFRCTFRKKRWLGGKTRQGFILTERSRLFIKEAEDLLQQGGSVVRKPSSQTRRKELLMAEIQRSPAYHKYVHGKGDLITEADVCYLLQGTLDSSRELLRKNFASLRMFADELERDEMGAFLTWIEERFRTFLETVGA